MPIRTLRVFYLLGRRLDAVRVDDLAARAGSVCRPSLSADANKDFAVDIPVAADQPLQLPDRNAAGLIGARPPSGQISFSLHLADRLGLLLRELPRDPLSCGLAVECRGRLRWRTRPSTAPAANGFVADQAARAQAVDRVEILLEAGRRVVRRLVIQSRPRNRSCSAPSQWRPSKLSLLLLKFAARASATRHMWRLAMRLARAARVRSHRRLDRASCVNCDFGSLPRAAAWCALSCCTPGAGPKARLSSLARCAFNLIKNHGARLRRARFVRHSAAPSVHLAGVERDLLLKDFERFVGLGGDAPGRRRSCTG
jgi:hypothetical protein